MPTEHPALHSTSSASRSIHATLVPEGLAALHIATSEDHMNVSNPERTRTLQRPPSARQPHKLALQFGQLPVNNDRLQLAYYP